MSRFQRSIYKGAPQTWVSERVRLWLSQASSSLDPGAIVAPGSLIETQDYTAVSINGGAAKDTVLLGATWFFPLVDAGGHPLDMATLWYCPLVLEVISPPSATSDLWLTAGITTDPTLGGNWRHGGLCWDAAGGPLLRAGHEAAYTDGAQSASTVHAVASFEIGPGSVQQARAWGLSSSGGLTGTSSRTGNWTAAGAPYAFVSLGRKTAVGGLATVQFRAWRFETLQTASYLP